MPYHSAAHRSIPLALALVVALLFSTPVLASAKKVDSAAIRAARNEAAAASNRLDELQAELEMRSEDYYAAVEALDKTRQRIRVAEDDLALAEGEVDQAQAQLATRASAVYRNGDLPAITLLLGVTDFEDLVTRVDLLARIGRSDAAVVARVKVARERVAETRAALERRRIEQTALVRTTQAKKARVDQAIGAQKDYLSTLNKKLERLIAEERARRERAAAAAAERARAAARRAAARNASNPAGRGGSSDANLGTSHADALAIARTFIGKVPYVWGGTSPSGFDCSGLTQYCYARIGHSIPRTSREQFHVGQFISPDDLDALRPGDLVFFGYDGDPGRIHHVGMYAGNGRYVHAPQTGSLVSESSLYWRIANRDDYVGAVRP